ANREVKRQKERIERIHYGRTIQVAYQLWKDNKIAEAHTLLAGTRADLRGWEYNYVHRLCHADLVTVEGSAFSVVEPVFSPDGSRVLSSGSRADTVRLWDPTTGKTLIEFEGHTDTVTHAAFNSDGSRIVTASDDKTARVWDAATGKTLVELK